MLRWGSGEKVGRARPVITFIYQAWNSVHIPVVESDLSTTWIWIQTACPSLLLLPRLFFPLIGLLLRDRKRDNRYCFTTLIPPLVHRILQSGSQVTVYILIHLHVTHWALLTSSWVREERKGKSSTCEQGHWELVSSHLSKWVNKTQQPLFPSAPCSAYIAPS